MTNDIQVAYLCDRKKCKNCRYPVCERTTDINHAKNFIDVGENHFMEKDPEDRGDEFMDDDTHECPICRGRMKPLKIRVVESNGHTRDADVYYDAETVRNAVKLYFCPSCGYVRGKQVI